MYEFRVYQVAVEIGKLAWGIYNSLPKQYQYSVGNQLVRAADSIGANIAEGYGRFSFKEKLYFTRIARGSLYETKHWLEIITNRFEVAEDTVKLLTNLIQKEAILINNYGRYLQEKISN